MADENISSKKAGSNVRKNDSRPWIEKHRPNTIKDLVSNPSTKIHLEKIVADGKLPNLIIAGQPGVGKTTTVLALGNQILGKTLGKDAKNGILEVDARGVNAIDSLEHYCKKSSNYMTADGKIAQYSKMIMLDEADRITDKAQMSVVRLMDSYPKVAFCFTCNDSSMIIEALQSKCTIFRYAPLASDAMFARLKRICELEGVEYSDKGLDHVVLCAKGDMRRAINILQSIHCGFGNVVPETIEKLYALPNLDTFRKVFDLCRKSDLTGATKMIRILQDRGNSVHDMLNTMLFALTIDKKIEDDMRMVCIGAVGKSMVDINKGFQTDLQLDRCLATMCVELAKLPPPDSDEESE
jgi:replication factor C subunit 2/4